MLHKKAQCITRDNLSVEKLTGAKQKITSIGESSSLYLTHWYFTKQDGSSYYQICLESWSDSRPQNIPKANSPEFSILVPCHFQTNNNGVVLVSTQNVDTTKASYFDSPDIRQAEQMLKSVELL